MTTLRRQTAKCSPASFCHIGHCNMRRVHLHPRPTTTCFPEPHRMEDRNTKIPIHLWVQRAFLSWGQRESIKTYQDINVNALVYSHPGSSATPITSECSELQGTLLGYFFRTKFNTCATLFKIRSLYTHDNKSSYQ